MSKSPKNLVSERLAPFSLIAEFKRALPSPPTLKLHLQFFKAIVWPKVGPGLSRARSEVGLGPTFKKSKYRHIRDQIWPLGPTP